ncbi:MAG: 50S ribosomal protein L35 [Candidatus Omnitrophota bacterium]|nr:MAG: 50S ribosomal protein L35 [Candidatus Omnitrophota bacterium]RKY35809.1 MAG: 50S ribosomal protein L35 [Candidatus Omnitrophota bacterium]RKY44651.1 MAG: 50S ribosomal protein L35 [Candidatus Omnitrophota bacterium]
MRKLKTKKALAKRVRITKKGKVLRRKAGKSHLLSSKSKKRKRQLRKQGLVKKRYTKMVKRALPYS